MAGGNNLAKRRIIIVTDGDRIAQKIVGKVAANIKGRAVPLSGGNPTPTSGEEILKAIKKTPHDPVLIMIDDCGDAGRGEGEQALRIIANDPEIEIIGAIAVASNTAAVQGAMVNLSITKEGQVVEMAVDKNGQAKPEQAKRVYGDTVDIFNELNIPIIVGIGDLGKTSNVDLPENGAKLTTMAVEEILKRSPVTVS